MLSLRLNNGHLAALWRPSKRGSGEASPGVFAPIRGDGCDMQQGIREEGIMRSS